MTKLISIDSKPLVKIPEGIYTFKCTKVEINPKMWTGKITLTLKVISDDEYSGTKLPLHFNYNPNQKPGQKSKLLRHYKKLFDYEMSEDQIDLDCFKDKVFKGVVKTVVSDYQKVRIDETSQYSEVSELIEILDVDGDEIDEETEDSLSEAEEQALYVDIDNEIADELYDLN